MLPTLNFYANHSLDFESTDYESLKYYTISELRKLDIPNDILLMAYNTLQSQFPGGEISAITKIADWCPISFPGSPDELKYTGGNIVSIGPMGMRIVFTPKHIILPSTIYDVWNGTPPTTGRRYRPGVLIFI
jgi:hypothetical protein